MNTEIYNKDCKGCKIAQGYEPPRGGIIELDGNWTLNHYMGKESFLGWVILQPRFHRIELADLNSVELNAFGRNIQCIDMALRQYWSINFKNDPIQQVYIIYFFESKYDAPPNKDKYHLHIHLIPRTRRLGQGDPSGKAAWNICKLSKEWPEFPKEYRIKDKAGNDINDDELLSLMIYLKGYLHR